MLCGTLEPRFIACFPSLLRICSYYLLIAGAVSWYDAFSTDLYGKHRLYKEVIHIVRNPINVIESRAYRLAIAGSNSMHREFLGYVAGQWEDVGDLFPGNSTSTNLNADEIKFALKHWVRRNAFVQKTASWVEQIEQLSTEPLVAWRMCMAAGFGPRCPPLENWRSVLGDTGKHTNTDHGKTSIIERPKIAWSLLVKLEPMYAAIAMKMSLEFGYAVPDEHLYNNVHYRDISTLQYQCGFDQNQKWDCLVV
jgi:hypothetical protein